MRWLWLVSVGASDIQFPAWCQDDTGAWSLLRRVEIGRQGNLRQVHEALLWLASEPDRVRLCSDDLAPVRLARGPSIEVESAEVDGQTMHSVRLRAGTEHDDVRPIRISASGEELPNAFDAALALYFPKVAPMARAMADVRGSAALTVIVLNTCRTSGDDAAREPVAAGPLVARFLAQELKLVCLDGGTAVPHPLPGGSCTWLDILQGSERLEDASVEDALRIRLNAAIDAFAPGPDDRVVISTSGGMPPLKPLLERVPATRVGSAAVSVLDNPEGSRGRPLSLQPLAERWLDRETLRFHCAQALRDGDYPSAYGLARRRQGSRWADKVVACLGPLLELPSASAGARSLAGLEPYELRAARVDAALAMRDVPAAIRGLGVFLESALWDVLRRSDALADAGLQIDPERELLYLAPDRMLDSDLEGLLDPLRDDPGSLRPRAPTMFTRLPDWLAQHERQSDLKAAARALESLGTAYGRRTGSRDAQGRAIDDSLRGVRNRLSHGAGPPVDLAAAQNNFLHRGLAAAIGSELGRNFLCQADAKKLLDRLGPPNAPDLASRLRDELKRTLEAVTRGEA